jgi:hypothetical protein
VQINKAIILKIKLKTLYKTKTNTGGVKYFSLLEGGTESNKVIILEIKLKHYIKEDNQ